MYMNPNYSLDSLQGRTANGSSILISLANKPLVGKPFLSSLPSLSFPTTLLSNVFLV